MSALIHVSRCSPWPTMPCHWVKHRRTADSVFACLLSQCFLVVFYIYIDININIYIFLFFSHKNNVFLFLCALGGPTRTNGCSPLVLYTRCYHVCMGLSMWLRPWSCNKAATSHTHTHTGKIDDFVQPPICETLPFCVRVCVWERIILVELPRLK